MTLGVLALDFAQYMRDDAMAAVNIVEETRGYYVAIAGMNRAMYELLEAQEAGELAGFLRSDFFSENAPQPSEGSLVPSVPPDGQWHEGAFHEATYRVRITDEGGRLPLNQISEGLLRTVITNLLRGGNRTEGVDRHGQKDIDTIAASILDWRDADGLVRNKDAGAESEYYLALRPPYHAKNGPFDAPEELLAVRGVTADLLYGTVDRPGLRDVFSVFSRRRVSRRTVTAPVLQALLGMDAETAALLIEDRTLEPQTFRDRLDAEIAATGDPLVGRAFSEDDEVLPSMITIEGRADVRQERNQARVAAVIDLEGDAFEGLRVVRWYDRAPWTLEDEAAEQKAAEQKAAEDAGA